MRPLPLRQRLEQLHQAGALPGERAERGREVEIAIVHSLQERARVDRAKRRPALGEDQRDEVAARIRTAPQVREHVGRCPLAENAVATEWRW
jgi:hypothetical protein